MTRPYISQALRRKVAHDAQHRCGYCLTSQLHTAMPMHIEHIIPVAAGGVSTEGNLWLACPLCNGFKGAQTEGLDLETGRSQPLFNPRQQIWWSHFQWSSEGTMIIGITPIGRATVNVLNLNNEHFLRARRRWVLAGWHPPTT